MPQLTTSMHKQTRIEYIIIRLLLALLLSTGCDISVYDVTTCYCIHPMHDKGALRFYDYCCRSSKDTIFQVYSNAGCLLSHYVASHLYLLMSILHRTWGLKYPAPSHCATQGRFWSEKIGSQPIWILSIFAEFSHWFCLNAKYNSGDGNFSRPKWGHKV